MRQRNKVYKLGDLEVGDRFYKNGKKSKTVYEVVSKIKEKFDEITMIAKARHGVRPGANSLSDAKKGDPSDDVVFFEEYQ